MKDYQNGRNLIERVIADPKQADEDGSTYKLLQEYFQGFPLETLRPLLLDRDSLIHGSALWIVSELGEKGSPLLHDVIPLYYSSKEALHRYYALDVIIVCSHGKYANRFLHVVRAMEDVEQFIRIRAMSLVSNANQEQLDSGLHSIDTWLGCSSVHEQGLIVLQKGDTLSLSDIQGMMSNREPILRKYGVILAKK